MEEHNVKEVNKDKLVAFLNKVKSKLDEGVENIGDENNKVIANWIDDIKKGEGETQGKGEDKSDKKTIEVSYNKELLLQKEKEKEEVQLGVYKEIVAQCNLLFDTVHTIPEKEEVFANILNKYLKEDNIMNDAFCIKKLESFLVELITQPEEKGNKTDEYMNQLTTSIKVMSALMKKIVTLSHLFQKDNIRLHVLVDYSNAFANSFSRLVYYPDFRLKLCISHAIGNIILYMLKEGFENDISTIILVCYSDIFCNIDQQVNKQDALTQPQPQDKSNGNGNNSIKESFKTLDSTKSILVEVISQLTILIDKYTKCQSVLIENINKLCLYIDNDTYMSILLLIYELLSIYLKLPFYVALIKENISIGSKTIITYDFKQVLLAKSSYHLFLPNPQLRFWVIKFLTEFNKVYQLKNDEYFSTNILPKICLNRYLPVDGVQKHSLALWKEIVDMSGIDLIKANYESYLIIYIKELMSQRQEPREAACRCIQELIMKVYQETSHKSIIEKYYTQMLKGILDCCRHASWNVRETGLIAIGYVYTNIQSFLTQDNKKQINDIIKYHCFDNIIEVRDASAFALKTLLLSNPNSYSDELNESLYLSLIKSLNDRTEIDKLFNDIRKELMSIMTNTQEQDYGFVRESDSIDFQDGIMHLIKELSDVPSGFLYTKGNMKISGIVMIVIDYLCKDYSVLSNLSKKTIWETLAGLFSKMKKDEIDMYLDYFIDILLKELTEHRNSLSGYQAERFLISICQGANKRMIKGKVKNKVKGNEALIKLFDKLLQ